MSSFKTALTATLVCLMTASSALGQTNQYRPNPQYQPPVSVRPKQQNNTPLPANSPRRMTAAQIRQLQMQRQQMQHQQQNQQPQNRQQMQNRRSAPPIVHRLSDSTLPNLGFEKRPQRGTNRQSIQKTSFSIQEEGEPVVPEILKGKKTPAHKPEIGQQQQKPRRLELPGETPVNQIDAKSSGGAKVASHPNLPLPNTQPNKLPNTLPANPNAFVPPTTQPKSNSTFPATQEQSLPPVVQQRSPLNNQSNIGGSLTGQKQPQLPMSNSNSIQPKSINTLSVQPSQNDNRFLRPSHTQTAGRINETRTPSIQVETIGPKTISKGKQTTYKIKVHNRSQFDSGSISVQLDLPTWVTISNVVTTIGHRQINQGQMGRQIAWSISNVSAGQTQLMTVVVVPTRAAAFDVRVNWAMEKKSALAKIKVTEPRLVMSISGPDEVKYGQKAMYTVTVKNTGTGTAEDIKVKLSEALGGAKSPLGHIAPGTDKKFQVELTARSPGALELVAMASGNANLRTSANKQVFVRRARLETEIKGPGMKYYGGVASYEVVVTNRGDAVAEKVIANLNLPQGVKYLSGVNGSLKRNMLSWNVGNMPAGDQRKFKINCQMNAAGQVKVDIGVSGANNLAAASSATTNVETIADLVLTVEDPKGPLPTGDEISYTIRIRNRGSRTASNVNLVMHFSEGVEPTGATGLQHKIAPGEVTFQSIGAIEPGKEFSVKVKAKAIKAGTHTFRAQLNCEESDSREVAQGTTKFYGETIQQKAPTRPASSKRFEQKQFNGGRQPQTNNGGQFNQSRLPTQFNK